MSKKNKRKPEQIFNSVDFEKTNSLTELALSIRTPQNQISRQDTSEASLRRNMVTYNRMLLSWLYVEIGIIQTLIEQPIEDAFSKSFEIKSGQLSPENIETLNQYLTKNKVIEKYKEAKRWARLYGGAGLIINTTQDPSTSFELNKLNKNSPLEFYAADRWELNYQATPTVDPSQINQDISDTPYNYYGQKLHKSRVIKINGKEAPPILKMQLMGWGMSEVERVIRPLNSYLKNTALVFELMDEAKIDVYKINGFTSTLLQKGGDEKIRKQVELSNTLKNYLNALLMDKEDEHEQKTLNFAGLPEILKEIRQDIASALKMPMTKLFGISASGFNSGEDDIENYNASIEREIRVPSKADIIQILEICCQILFGFIPEDLDIIFPALRTMTTEQEENIKTQSFARVMQALEKGLITDEQAVQAINKGSLLPIDIAA